MLSERMKRIEQTNIDFRCRSAGNSGKGDALLQENTFAESYKLLYVYAGACSVAVDGVSHTVSKGCSVLVYPLSVFTVGSGAQYAWVEFSGFAAATILSRIAFSETSPVLGDIGIDRFESYFDIPLFSGQPYVFYRQGALVLLLLSYYIERFPSKTVETQGYVFRACRYIDTHLSVQGFGVKDVANALKIDRSYLYRLFMEEVGVSVMDYITGRRMSKAKVMLANSTLSIKDVAYSVGFSDQMYFSRMFTQRNGLTPTAFRERLLNGSDTPRKR